MTEDMAQMQRTIKGLQDKNRTLLKEVGRLEDALLKRGWQSCEGCQCVYADLKKYVEPGGTKPATEMLCDECYQEAKEEETK